MSAAHSLDRLAQMQMREKSKSVSDRLRAWASSAGMPMTATPPSRAIGFADRKLTKSSGTPWKSGTCIAVLHRQHWRRCLLRAVVA